MQFWHQHQTAGVAILFMTLGLISAFAHVQWIRALRRERKLQGELDIVKHRSNEIVDTMLFGRKLKIFHLLASQELPPAYAAQLALTFAQQTHYFQNLQPFTILQAFLATKSLRPSFGADGSMHSLPMRLAEMYISHFETEGTIAAENNEPGEAWAAYRKLVEFGKADIRLTGTIASKAEELSGRIKHLLQTPTPGSAI